jgi:hypothetical protein
VVNDLDVQLTEEVLHRLAEEDSLTDGFCHLSLHALTTTEVADCIKLRAPVQNKVLLILLDGGSSHSFVCSAFLQQAGIPSVIVPSEKVKLPNGEVLLTDQMVP